MSERAFFVRGDDGNEYGPVFLPELREWVRENRAGLGTMVRLEEPESSPWQAWQEFPELVVLLAEGNAAGVYGMPDVVLAPFMFRVGAALLDMILCSILTTPIIWCYLTIAPEESKSYQDFVTLIITHAVQNDTTPIDPAKTPQVVFNMDFIFIAVWVIYLTGFLFAHGKTPAKALFGIRVVNDQGRPPTLLQSTIRAICFVFAFATFYGITLLIIPYIFGGTRRALHDVVGGTLVIRAPKSN